MWKSKIWTTYDGAFVVPQEVDVFDTPNTVLIDAELCRDSDCTVRHIFPVDVVFVAHKKGPLQRCSGRSAPGVDGARYPDGRDISEGKETVQKRHLSELVPHRASGLAPELAWTAIHSRMVQAFRTYPKPEKLKRFKDLIIDRLEPACKEARDYVKVYGRVFAHLMFDRVYFGAVQRSGFENFDKSFPFPLIPAELSDEDRSQWIADFRDLVAYSEDHSETAYRKSALYHCGKETKKSDVRKASPVFVGRRCKAADEKTSVRITNPVFVGRRRENKLLADENARMEAVLERKKTTLKALTSKIAAKTQESAGGREEVVVVQLRSAITALLQRSSNVRGNPETMNASAPEDANPEVVMLTEQLKNLEHSTERLQNEAVELRKQLTDARQQKKTAAKRKN